VPRDFGKHALEDLVKDLLKTSNLTVADMSHLLDLAASYKENPLQHRDLLAGSTAVLYFAKPSTRTRLSFEAAVTRLGGVPSTVGPQELQVSRGETLEDTAMVVSRYAAAFVIRTYADDDVQLVSQAASIPVINALTDLHHPCQSLADILTLKQQWGTFEGKKLAWLGAGTNVLHSLMEACALAGISLTAATPEEFLPDAGVVATAQAIAATTGATIEVTTDPYQAAWNADAVYTDDWVSMGDSESTRAVRVKALTPYRVTPGIMGDLAAPDAIFMHCLPAHRGEEVTAEVIDGPQSVVFDQAENRLHTAQAVLYALLTGSLTGNVSEATTSLPMTAGKVKVA
jgi:ornithine carbamoyltransferase